MLNKSVLARLMTTRVTNVVTGNYNTKTQTWSHRDPSKFSPVKHNREA
ncbi:MAG: hypothetical protein WAZ40_02690 [Minisyncoccia bacterium]